jgi:hypothetical protein
VLQVLQIDWVGIYQNLSYGFGKGNHVENQGSRVMSLPGCQHQGHTNRPNGIGDNEGYLGSGSRRFNQMGRIGACIAFH